MRDQILEAIRKGNNTFAKLCRVFGMEDPYVWNNKVASKRVDSALQKMRREGVLAYDRKTGWRVK